MKCTIPEISWHNRDPVLSVDIQPITSEGFYRLASGGTDSHVLIWHLKINTGATKVEPVSDLTRHQRAVNVVRWSYSGQYLASGDDDANIIIWHQKSDDLAVMLDGDNEDKEKWSVFKVLRGHKEDVYDICWSPDSSKLISGSVDNTAIIWDLHKGVNDNILTDHKGFVQGVTWDPLGNYIATLSSDRICRVFNETGKQVKARIKRGLLPVQESHDLHGETVTYFHDDTLKSFFRRLTFSPDGSLIITPAGCLEMGPNNTKLYTSYIYSTTSLTQPAVILPSPGQYTVAARCCPILFQLHPEGPDPVVSLPYRIIFAIATRSSVILYDTQQTTPFATISNIHYTRLTDVTWSQDGRLLAVSSTDGFCSLVIFEPEELGIEYIKEPEVMEEDLNETVEEVMEVVNISVEEKKEEKKEKKPSFLQMWTKKAVEEKSAQKRKADVIVIEDDETANKKIKEDKPVTPIAVRRKPKENATDIIDVPTQDNKTKPSDSSEKNKTGVSMIQIRRKPREATQNEEKSGTSTSKGVSEDNKNDEAKKLNQTAETSNIEEVKPKSPIASKDKLRETSKNKSEKQQEIKELELTNKSVEKESQNKDEKLTKLNAVKRKSAEHEKLDEVIDVSAEKKSSKDLENEPKKSRLRSKSNEKEQVKEKKVAKPIAVKRKPKISEQKKPVENKSPETKKSKNTGKSESGNEISDKEEVSQSSDKDSSPLNIEKPDCEEAAKAPKINIDSVEIVENEKENVVANPIPKPQDKITPKKAKNLDKKRTPKRSTPSKSTPTRKKTPGGQLDITLFLKSTPKSKDAKKPKAKPVVLLEDYNQTGKTYRNEIITIDDDSSCEKNEIADDACEKNEVVAIDDDSREKTLAKALNFEDDSQSIRLVLEETLDEPPTLIKIDENKDEKIERNVNILNETSEEICSENKSIQEKNGADKDIKVRNEKVNKDNSTNLPISDCSDKTTKDFEENDEKKVDKIERNVNICNETSEKISSENKSILEKNGADKDIKVQNENVNKDNSTNLPISDCSDKATKGFKKIDETKDEKIERNVNICNVISEEISSENKSVLEKNYADKDIKAQNKEMNEDNSTSLPISDSSDKTTKDSKIQKEILLNGDISSENCDTKSIVSNPAQLEDKLTPLANFLSKDSPAKKRVPLITISSPKHKKKPA